jgi:hypothetical protein
MIYPTPCNSAHSSAGSNVLNIDQYGIVRSIREKCDLVEHLISGSENWVTDIDRNSYNEHTIEDLIISSKRMLNKISNESSFLEAAKEIDKILLKLNRIKEATTLYGYYDNRFNG